MKKLPIGRLLLIGMIHLQVTASEGVNQNSSPTIGQVYPQLLIVGS